MSISIETPNISASTDQERLQQIQSYLYRMAHQLQWAFDSLKSQTNTTSQSAAQPTTGDKRTASAENDTFSGIKDLIIKSADIVNAYYAAISKRLDGKYVAQSDFGTYTEETSLEIQENNNSINQLFTSVRTLSDTVDALYDGASTTNAYLKSGLLYNGANDSPVYGLEIGQTNNVDGTTVFNKFARFTADRLSFYDSGDIEVAYISDYRLYISNVEISGNLWFSGKFKIWYNSGLAFQWIGG